MSDPNEYFHTPHAIQQKPVRIKAAPYMARVIAFIIDFTISFTVGFIGLIILGFMYQKEVMDEVLLKQNMNQFLTTSITMYVCYTVWQVWYFGYNAGVTGYTPGKKIMRIQLVHQSSGKPPGPGIGCLRLIVPQFIGSFTIYIFTIIDYLFPLMNDHGHRVTDKMFDTVVIQANDTE